MPTINPDGTFADNTVTLGLKSAYAEISCSSSIAESSLDEQDADKNYPLGLQDFCLEVPDSNTQDVTLTYETDLTPSDVKARKYNSATQRYTDIAEAAITEANIGGVHVLVLKYQVTDGGSLDDDGQVNGTIHDPVGLAVNVQSNNTNTGSDDVGDLNSQSNGGSGQSKQNGGLANTGMNILAIMLAGATLLGLSLITARRFSPKARR